MLAPAVGVEHGSGALEERLAAGHREERELQQGQGRHPAGVVEGQLRGDGGAAGVAGDVGPVDAEVVEQRGGVGRVVLDRHGPLGVGAAHPAALVVPDELVALERRLRHERQEAVGQHGADQQHRLAGSGHLVLQLDAVERCGLHGSSSGRDRRHGVRGPYPRGVSNTVTAVTLADRRGER